VSREKHEMGRRRHRAFDDQFATNGAKVQARAVRDAPASRQKYSVARTAAGKAWAEITKAQVSVRVMPQAVKDRTDGEQIDG
jgi:hypothetical protein